MEHFYQNICDPKANKWAHGAIFFAAGIGALSILRLSTKLLYNCFTYCFRFKQDLLSKYGIKGKTYAVVTGGSDGLGLELCDSLAEQGFNICIISRNRDKIDKRIGELREKHPLVQYKSVQADLSALATMAEYNELVARELSDLDIGILCLNAGCTATGTTDTVSDFKFQQVFTLNGLHVVYLTKALIKQLM